MKFEWENISIIETNIAASATSRAKVRGGWIIKHATQIGNRFVESMVFIADISHQWQIDEE